MHDHYNRDRTQIRNPDMRECDSKVVKKQNQRIRKLEKRRKESKKKSSFLKSCSNKHKKWLARRPIWRPKRKRKYA